MSRIDEDKTIHLTRGDIAGIEVDAEEKDDSKHTFQPGDVEEFVTVSEAIKDLEPIKDL